MEKRNFKLIQGGKYDQVKTAVEENQTPKWTYIEGMATATRLMGVVGVIGTFEDETGRQLTQIVHLDYEEYGIDGYFSFPTTEQEDIQRTIQKVTGGLGGEYVTIDYPTYCYLIQSAYKVDPTSVHIAYDIEAEFPQLLRDHANPVDHGKIYMAWMDEIAPKCVSEIETIQYYMMRLTGLDEESLKYLTPLSISEEWHDLIRTPGTLIKNTVKAVSQNHYHVESLVDHYDRYKMILSEVSVEKVEGRFQIKSHRLTNTMNISAYEASFQLRKREHMAIYTIVVDEFAEKFDELFPEFMVNGHGAGDLYTEFNPNNNHVREDIYYLNGDVYANYFLTDEEQLIVSSLNNEHLLEIEERLLTLGLGKDLVLMGEMTADQPILYEFVRSGYGNIYEYLSDTEGEY